MIQMSVTQSQTLIRQILDPPWIPWPSPKPSRTPSHHQAAKELAAVVTAAAVRRRRASKGLPAAATGLNQAQQSAALAVVVVAARAKRRRALPPHRPRVAAVRNHLRHRQRRTRMNIAVLVPQNTPNLRARVTHLRRVARVAAVRAAVAVTRIRIKIRIRTARARASIAHRRARQRANQKGALPLTADRVLRASRKTRRVVRNLPHLRVATSQSQRVVAVAASTHDIIDRGLGAAVDRQVM